MTTALVAVSALVVSGCGLHGSSQAALVKAPAHTPGRTLAAGPLAVGATRPAHVRLDMSHAIGSGMACDSAPNTLPLAQRAHDDRAAVIARVVAIGAPVWNTLDGKRPTQAQADAMFNPPGLSVFTPFELSVVRVLSRSPVVALVAGADVTGFVRGGTTPFGDRFSGCFSVPAVPLGSTAVVFFGTEIDTGALSPAGLHRPEVREFDPIHGGVATTALQGPQPVP